MPVSTGQDQLQQLTQRLAAYLKQEGIVLLQQEVSSYHMTFGRVSIAPEGAPCHWPKYQCSEVSDASRECICTGSSPGLGRRSEKRDVLRYSAVGTVVEKHCMICLKGTICLKGGR